MQTLDPFDALEFHPQRPAATPLLVGDGGRVLRFAFEPGQELTEHAAPSSPLHVVVLRGEGLFAGADGVERRLGPGAVAVFAAGEPHRVRALDERLVFLALLHKVERSDTAHAR